VPWMLRSAFSAFTRVFDALWRRAADPGSIVARGPGSAVHREERCTASGTREALLHTLSARRKASGGIAEAGIRNFCVSTQGGDFGVSTQESRRKRL
jgi:hypothetical protein